MACLARDAIERQIEMEHEGVSLCMWIPVRVGLLCGSVKKAINNWAKLFSDICSAYLQWNQRQQWKHSLHLDPTCKIQSTFLYKWCTLPGRERTAHVMQKEKLWETFIEFVNPINLGRCSKFKRQDILCLKTLKIIEWGESLLVAYEISNALYKNGYLGKCC